MLKAVIVDDEISAREALRALIENFIVGVEIVAEAESVAAAVRTIRRNDLSLRYDK